MTMREKNCVIVGGSIAGCAMAILLKRLGVNVTVLERSSGNFTDRGAGIMLPEAIVEQCIALDLFDKNIPHVVMQGRSFSRKSLATHDFEKFWDQPIRGIALNWIHVFQNLRKRLDAHCYHAQTTVQHIQKKNQGYEIVTSQNKRLFADCVIAADGVDSTVRAQLLATVTAEYAGYIAWRGIAKEVALPVENHVPYFVFQTGHILLYHIPAVDYEKTGKTVLNWLLYENNSASLKTILKDKHDNVHERSVPVGYVSDTQINHLHAFAKSQLPKFISDIVCKTQYPFIQAIFDSKIPTDENNDLIFAGDAATTLRPHSGSGVLKALQNAITFYQCILENPSCDVATLISQWKKMQFIADSEEMQKAKIMGDALVTHPPDWNIMTQETTDAWWSAVMRGRTWYAVDKK